MRILIIDQAISECKSHLDSTNSRNSEIESFLTQYLLILIYSCFENEIKRIFIKRFEKITDIHIKEYLKHTISNKLGKIKSSELADILEKFGSDYKTEFNNWLNTGNEITYYNNLIINRHQTAHVTGSNFTFDELQKSYEKGHVVLDYLDLALEN